MKAIHYFYVALLILITSCSSTSDEPETVVNDDLSQLALIQKLENDSHTVELYNKNGKLEEGYNTITLRIQEKATGKFIKNADIRWEPVMQMTAMEHSCPYSAITKVPDQQNLYNGHIVFQMPEKGENHWTLALHYTIDCVNYTVKNKIGVISTVEKRVVSFEGSDKVKYVLAMIDPIHPKVALNDMTAILYKSVSPMHFSTVDGYTIAIDPRMQAMFNHGSPNNENLVQVAPGGLYKGKLSLTMTGDWTINLQVLNTANKVIKGEDIEADDSEYESSICFEIAL